MTIYAAADSDLPETKTSGFPKTYVGVNSFSYKNATIISQNDCISF